MKTIFELIDRLAQLKETLLAEQESLEAINKQIDELQTRRDEHKRQIDADLENLYIKLREANDLLPDKPE